MRPSGRRAGVLAAAVFCALALVLLLVWQSRRAETAEGGKAVVVEVIHSDGTAVEFHYRTELEYLGELLTEEGLISGTEGPYGLFVDTVDGETADYDRDGGWWRLTCGGEDAESGVDGVVLEDGGEYGWVYTTG